MPLPQSQEPGDDRTRREKAALAPREPAAGNIRFYQRRPQARRRDCHQNAEQAPPSEPSRPVLKCALRLQHQPAGAEQAVAEDQRDARKDREGREAIERAASELTSRRLKALDESTKHNSLRKGGEGGAIAESVVPEGPMLGGPVTEFEGDAAKDEREQHNQHGKVDSGQDDREGERKRCQTSDAAQHEPRLVAVP